MTVQIVVYLNADTHGKECFTYLDDEFGRREYDALAGPLGLAGLKAAAPKRRQLVAAK